MQRWYLGRNKPRSSSIPTALGDSPGLWERIWENSELTSESGSLTQGAGSQQRFGTRLCPRQAPHCPSSHQRAFSTSCITKRAHPRVRTPSQLPPHATAVHPHPSCQHRCTPQHPIAQDGHPQGMGCSAGCGVGQELCAPWVSCQSPNPAQRASKDRRREQSSSCPARSCWERDPQPCRLSSCLAQVNSFDASCPHQLSWLALVPQP